MEQEDVERLLGRLRRLGGEPSEVEVKAAAGGLPNKAAVESASAFANTNGGLIVLGVDETAGFSVVDLPAPAKLRDDLASALSDQLEPPLRPWIDLVEVDGRVVVVAEIAPSPSDQKPCYVTSRGIATGSYVRTGDGDRRMTQAEIGLTIANRGQPIYDAEPVPGATVEELDSTSVLRFLERTRSTSRSLRDVDDEIALRRLHVLVRDDSQNLVPSIAGLLALGRYPQEFFPQLMVSMVVHSGGEGVGENARFLDNQQFRGPIPELVDETVAGVRRNIAVRGFVNGEGRQDRLEYPLEAVREAVVNALLHRDYSPVSRGTQVAVNLYPDRLVITSPGALFGPVTVADLGEEGISSSRNGYLAQVLSDTFMPQSSRLVAENRASGVPAMIREVLRSGLPRPQFSNYPGRFEVRFDRSELLDPDTRRWLREVRRPGFTHLHDLGLAHLSHGNELTNESLREFGASRTEATQVLGDLVTAGLATRFGGRRYARYELAAPHRQSADELFPDLFGEPDEISTYDAVVAAFRRAGRMTAAELARDTNRSRQAVLAAVRKLIEEGRVRANGAPTSPRRVYLWWSG